MSTTATTVRFSEEERTKIVAIQKNNRLPTLQKTIDFLINRHGPQEAMIEHLKLELRRTNERNTELESAIGAYIRGIHAINNIEIL